MKNPFIVLIIGIIASLFLGSFSNWIYDLLRANGFFPNKITIRTVIFIGLCSIILLLLVAFPNIPDQNLKAISEVLSLQIRLWAVLILCIVSCFIGFLFNYLNAQKFRRLFTDKEQLLSETQKKLDESERRLSHYLSSQNIRPGTVINPK